MPKPKSKPNAAERPSSKSPRAHAATKQDGTPWTPWSDRINASLARREERAKAGLPPLKTAKRQCKAFTTGVHGPKRRCVNGAVNGLTVCRMHGGGSKASKAAAKRRLLDELDPTISRLVQIRDQNDHYPSALGASAQILNRVLGKPDSVDKDRGVGASIIQIGINLGGLPLKAGETKVLPSTTERTDEDEDVTLDAEYETEPDE